MFGFKTDPKKELWRWLASHRSQIHNEIKGPGSPTSHHWSIHELGERLKSVDEGLAHEIGMFDPSTIELIISAEGVQSLFPVVIELVKSAPPMNGFKITAFKQRSPEGFQLEVEGRRITDETLSYRLIQEGDELGLELFIDSDLDDRQRAIVGFLSLDQRLGEYDVATGLRWIEFAAGRPADALPVTQLVQDFDSRRVLTKH